MWCTCLYSEFQKNKIILIFVESTIEKVGLLLMCSVKKGVLENCCP